MTAATIPIEMPTALTPALRHVLGFMCFDLARYAQAYQKVGRFVDSNGESLSKRAEDEQAFMLHRFLTHWAKAGEDWHASFAVELQEVLDLIKAQAATDRLAKAGGASND